MKTTGGRKSRDTLPLIDRHRAIKVKTAISYSSASVVQGLRIQFTATSYMEIPGAASTMIANTNLLPGAVSVPGSKQ